MNNLEFKQSNGKQQCLNCGVHVISPLILSCRHILCFNCAEQLNLMNHCEEFNSITCPLCNRETLIQSILTQIQNQHIQNSNDGLESLNISKGINHNIPLNHHLRSNDDFKFIDEGDCHNDFLESQEYETRIWQSDQSDLNQEMYKQAENLKGIDSSSNYHNIHKHMSSNQNQHNINEHSQEFNVPQANEPKQQQIFYYEEELIHQNSIPPEKKCNRNLSNKGGQMLEHQNEKGGIRQQIGKLRTMHYYPQHANNSEINKLKAKIQHNGVAQNEPNQIHKKQSYSDQKIRSLAPNYKLHANNNNYSIEQLQNIDEQKGNPQSIKQKLDFSSSLQAKNHPEEHVEIITSVMSSQQDDRYPLSAHHDSKILQVNQNNNPSFQKGFSHHADQLQDRKVDNMPSCRAFEVSRDEELSYKPQINNNPDSGLEQKNWLQESSHQIQERPLVCKEHDDYIQLYCPEDKALLCVNCFYQNDKHKRHRVAPLKRSLDLIKKENQLFKLEAKEKLGLIDKSVKICSSNQKILQEGNKFLSECVSKEFSEIHRVLEEQEQKIQTKIQAVFEERVQEYNHILKDLIYLQNCIREYRDCDKNQDANLTVYVFSIYSMIRNTLKNIDFSFKQISKDDINICDFRNNRKKIISEISQFGNIINDLQVRDPDSSFSGVNKHQKQSHSNNSFRAQYPTSLASLANLTSKQNQLSHLIFKQQNSSSPDNQRIYQPCLHPTDQEVILSKQLAQSHQRAIPFHSQDVKRQSQSPLQERGQVKSNMIEDLDIKESLDNDNKITDYRQIKQQNYVQNISHQQQQQALQKVNSSQSHQIPNQFSNKKQQSFKDIQKCQTPPQNRRINGSSKPFQSITYSSLLEEKYNKRSRSSQKKPPNSSVQTKQE